MVLGGSLLIEGFFAQQTWRDLPVLAIVGMNAGSFLFRRSTTPSLMLPSGRELDTVAFRELGQLRRAVGLCQQVQALDNHPLR